MARARNIKPGFFTNDVLCELPALTRLLFAGIWTICDRSGRLEDRPKKIRAEVLPYDVCDPEEMLQALEKNGFISRYSAGGKCVIQVLAWGKHQNPHSKETASTLPTPDGFIVTPEPAQDKNSASTMQAPDEEQPLPALAGLIPSSLIPSSLIPDSNTHTALGNQPPVGTDVPVCVLVCQAMRDAGIGDANPLDAGLAVLVGKGATPGMFAAAAPMAVKLGKGFAYAVGIVKNQLSAAASMAYAPIVVPAGRPGKADVSRVTVPASATADAALRHIAADAAIPRSGPPAELVERLAKRRGSVAAAAGVDA